MTVVFAGTGAALHPYRGQSSVVLDAGGILVAVDLGCSALNVLARLGYDPTELSYVIATHGHYDHICGIPHLAFLKTFDGPPRLSLGGPGEALDQLSRILSGVRGGRSITVSYRAVEELAAAGVKVAFFDALHTVPAVGVLVEYSGVRVLVSGDTRPTSVFKSLASGAALAVHEATMPPGKAELAAEKGHSTVDQAIDQVSPAGLGALYHLTPSSEAAALRLGGARGILVPVDGAAVRVC